MIAPLPFEQTLVIAPLLGLAFGWFLERGGLASAPRLAGQFYLTDLRVFKVMFSALVTAMLGAFWLDRVGFIDLRLIELPATFLLPQAAGGALFGVGFLIAGLCPGTSCVAATSGRLDGFGVIAGIFAGVAIFNGAYPFLSRFCDSTARGGLTVAEVMRVPRGAAVALVTALALAGFFVAERIEKRR